MSVTNTQDLTAVLGHTQVDLSFTQGPVRVGRDDSSDLRSMDVYVSRVHGSLTRQHDGTWVYTDVGSSGGSYLSGQRINSVIVAPGLVLRLGHVHGEALTFSGPAYHTVYQPPLGLQVPQGLGPAQPPAMPTVGFAPASAGPSQVPMRGRTGTPGWAWALLGAALVVVALLVVGVSTALQGVRLDVAEVERTIRDGIRTQSGIAADVNCPSAMEGEQGDEFNCVVKTRYGNRMVAVRIENNAGDITWWTR